MKGTSDRARRQLHALARSKGVEVRWRAQDGSMQTCSDETLLAVLQMLHVDVARPEDATRARAELHHAHAATMIEPVVVAWDGAAPIVTLRLPARAAGADADFALVAEHESGEESRWTGSELLAGTMSNASGGENLVELAIELPHGFAAGRHRLRVEAGGKDATATLIAAPRRLPLGRGRRAWGLFAPVYALHGRARPGAGDLATLEQLASWMAARGGTIVGTLPILAMFAGHGKEPCDPSPYAPVSRRFWNELYLDLDALPERAGEPPFRNPPSGRSLDLPAIAAARRPLLEAAARQLHDTPSGRAHLEQGLNDHPGIRDYARFRAEMEGSGADGVALHEYVQWAMTTQLHALAGTLDGRGQSLYIDLPVGTHRDGYDVAMRPDLFLVDASVGAPPDGFQPTGQDWGFPPLDPAAARADGHAYLASCFDEQLQYARLLRLDHVMGLHRLWMIPVGTTAAEGAFVHYPAEEQWATICLSASRNGATIVGENLGTVPAETNHAMRRHRALGMWVTEFELPDDDADDDTGGVTAPGAGVLACIDTHDLPTFAAWWDALAPKPRAALLAALRASGDLEAGTAAVATDPGAVLTATLAWLGRSRAPIVLAALEDLWLEPSPQNIPGAGHQDESFRQQAAYAIEDLDDLPSVTGAVDALEHARRSTT